MMKIEDPSDPTKEIELYTRAELTEREAAKDVEIATAKAEADALRKVSSEKTENFKKLNELTAEEKGALSAEKIEAMARAEAAEAKLAGLEEKYNTDTQNRIKTDKETALAKFHGGNTDLKKVLEDNYELINITGTDTESINQRAQKAVEMYNGSVGRQSPLTASYSGGAPVHKDATRTEDFLKSDKAKSALKAMGEKVD